MSSFCRIKLIHSFFTFILQNLINDDLFITKSKLLLLRPSASIRVSPWLNIEYLVDVSTTRTFVEGEKKNNIEFVKHQFNLFAFPFIDHQINIVTEYYQYSSTDYYFLDISYKYSFNRPELELEFRWNNILNTTSYTTYNVSGSSLLESTYVIRPSQILATIRFNF